MAERSRAEHLAWCKTRALAYVDNGDCASAVVSLLSDLGKWEGGPLYPDGTLRYLAMNGSFCANQGRVATWRWIEALT